MTIKGFCDRWHSLYRACEGDISIAEGCAMAAEMAVIEAELERLPAETMNEYRLKDEVRLLAA